MFEFWSRGGDDPTVVPVVIGYKNCVIEDNIVINSGHAWSSDVRPDALTKVDILMYEMYAKMVDISFKGNVFYDTKGAHIFTPDGVEQYLDFVEATGLAK